ncbi:MAG TPA: hypothetical protein VLM85_09465 [Polyangiaceae bacterium]|nr:hypothetical protein [Polyangiaceae bacterium]
MGDSTIIVPDSGPDGTTAPDVADKDVTGQDTQSDVIDAAACATDAGMLVCNGVCVDPKTSATNCGACNHDCLGGTCGVLDGGATPLCQPIVLASGITTSAFALATDGTSVVFTDNSTGAYSLSVNGTSQTPFQVGSGSARPITIVNGNMYWMVLGNNSPNQIWKGQPGKTGAAALNIGAGTLNSFPPVVPYGIAVDSQETYVGFLEYGSTTDYFGSCSLVTTPVCATSSKTGESALPGNMVTDNAHLFWTEGSGNIAQTALSFGSVTNIITGQAVPNVMSMAGPGYFVWYNAGNATIYRSPILSPTAQNLTTNTYVTSIAADATNVYWSTTTSIMYVDQTGSGTPKVLVDNVQPGAIARDSKAIYWYNGDGTIMKVALPL